MIGKTRSERREAGLTLLEVLAAAMIFAMVMTVLIGTSSNAVHHVGVSARRLEAGLVADNLLSDLEIQIKQGTAPEVENDEFTDEQFSIRMTMSDLGETPAGIDPESAQPLAPPSDIGGGRGDVASLLREALPEVAGHLRRYDIEVSWLEQNGPQSVIRTTFAYDWETARVEVLASLIESASSNELGRTGRRQGKAGSSPPPGQPGRGTPTPGFVDPRGSDLEPGSVPYNGHNARANQTRRRTNRDSGRANEIRDRLRGRNR